MPPAEELCDLHCIERRALAQIVADAPQVEAVLDRRILPDTADERSVIAGALHRGHVPAVLALVDEHDPRRLTQNFLRFLGGDLALELDVHRLGVTDEYRDTYASRSDLDLRVEDLLGLDDHLPFFLRRSVVEKAVDVRNHVERNLLGELLVL